MLALLKGECVHANGFGKICLRATVSALPAIGATLVPKREGGRVMIRYAIVGLLIICMAAMASASARAQSLDLIVTLTDGPTRLDVDGIGLETFSLDGVGGDDIGHFIGVARSHSQVYTVEIEITNGGSVGGLADLGFAERLQDGFALTGDGEAFADNNDVNAACVDGLCDGIIEETFCTVTVSGPVGRRGAIDPQFIVIEADALPASNTCTTKLYFATLIVSKQRGGNPPVYAPADCRVGLNDDESGLVYPFPINQGVAIINDLTGAVLPGKRNRIQLQVLGGCP